MNAEFPPKCLGEMAKPWFIPVRDSDQAMTVKEGRFESILLDRFADRNRSKIFVE